MASLWERGVLDAGLLVRKFADEDLHQAGLLDLGPAEVALFHLFFVVLHPPVPILKERAHHNRIITFSYEILIDYV